MVTRTAVQHQITEGTVTILVALPVAIMATTVSLHSEHTAKKNRMLIRVPLYAHSSLSRVFFSLRQSSVRCVLLSVKFSLCESNPDPFLVGNQTMLP